MINRWPYGSFFGILGVLEYIVLTHIAYLFYPAPYSPLTNALSHLGDPLLNSSGAIFYNLGGILLGLLLIPFYLSMNGWNTGERSHVILTAGAQIAGIASSMALISSCIFPTGTHTPIHVVSAGTAEITSVFFWIFSGFSMLKNPGRMRWLPYFGYLPLTSILVLAFVLKERFLIEWVSVSFFLIYVILLATSSRRISNVAKELRQKAAKNLTP